VEELLLRIVTSLGVPGLVTYCGYRLLDKWFGKFLEVHDKQATAIAELANVVKNANAGQQEVIMAVRVLAAKVDDLTGWVKETAALNPGAAK
jgi:hypothetical protein